MDGVYVVNELSRITLTIERDNKMLKKEIEIDKVYCAKISGKLSPVRILSVNPYNSSH